MNTYKITLTGGWIRQEVAETIGKARYKAYLYFKDIFNLDGFGDFLFRIKSICKIGSFKVSDLFGDSETFEHIKRHRNIDFAYMGMRVEICGKMGTIVGGNDCMNIDVIYDGCYSSYNCHPWYKIKYFDCHGNLIKEYK